MVKPEFIRRLVGSFLLVSFFLFCGGFVHAQEVNPIQGHVYDENHDPVIGATVALHGSTNATVTDAEGHFEISGKTGDTLGITAIGYEDKLIVIEGQDNIEVILEAKITSLKDVTITALGIKKETRALNYSTQEISGSDLTQVNDPTGNVMNSLSGKVANLMVTPSGSGIGGSSRVILRGNRSINGNNNALIVVDGVPIDNTMSVERAGGGSANTLGTQVKSISSSYSGMDGAASINPDDIESVTVLKGPTAAALYGSRAANGALLITTKSGKKGDISVNYDLGISTDQPYFVGGFQNIYGRGNGGTHGQDAAQSWGEKTKTNPNNVKNFYEGGSVINNSISASGGTDNIQGYLSYTNNLIKGIVPENDLHQDNLNLRVTAQPLPRLEVDAKMTYSNKRINHLPRLGDNGIHNEVYIMPRDLSTDSLKVFERTDELTGQPVPIYWTNSSIFQNPYWDVYRMNVTEERSRIILQGSIKYELTDWLDIQGRYNLDRYDDLLTGSFYENTVPINEPGGKYQETNINHWERNMDVLLSGKNDLSSSLSIDYQLGASLLNIRGGSTMTESGELNIPNKFNFNFASNIAVNSLPIEKEIQSVYGNVQLSLQDFLYLDGSLRNDWSSTLPSPYSFAYPSVGLSLILSSILDLPEWIYFGKVRAAYSSVGNDADPYQLAQRYQYSLGAGNGFVSREDTKSIGDKLKPEKTRSLEIGIDWRFLGGKINLDATYYKSNTINQLLRIGLPQASGFSYQYVNVGNIENKGFEMVLSANPLHSSSFDWHTGINFSLNRNKVIRLSEGIKQTTLSPSSNFGQLLIKPGGAYGDIYGYGWAIDEKTGKYLVGDNGLPVATESNDKKIGNFNPDYLLGWTNKISLNKFFLQFQIDGRIGGIIMSGTDAMQTNFGVSEATTKFREGGLVLEGVHPDGTANTTDINAEELWTTLSNGGRSSGYDEFFAFDATNFRLREFSLGYHFDLRSRFIKDMSLSFSAKNLFFIYRGRSLLDIPGIGKRKIPIDPEYAIGTSNFQGIESGLPPAVRSFGLKLHLSF